MKLVSVCLTLLLCSQLASSASLESNIVAEQLLANVRTLEKESPSSFLSKVSELIIGLVNGDIHAAAAFNDTTMAKALAGTKTQNVILILNGNWATQDHGNQPFISVDPKSKLAAKLIPFLGYMNAMSRVLQKFTPQKFIPFTLSTFRSDNAANGYTFSVVDLTNGYLYINEEAMKSLVNVRDEDLHQSYQKLTRHVKQQAVERGDQEFEDHTELFTAFGLSLEELVLNPWVECLGCMVILVFLAPLLANYVLINLALYLCSALGLTENVCTALWSSAAALVFVALPVIAYGIYTACGLYQCQHPATATKAARMFL